MATTDYTEALTLRHYNVRQGGAPDLLELHYRGERTPHVITVRDNGHGGDTYRAYYMPTHTDMGNVHKDFLTWLAAKRWLVAKTEAERG